jgi:hypothetical protein
MSCKSKPVIEIYAIVHGQQIPSHSGPALAPASTSWSDSDSLGNQHQATATELLAQLVFARLL